MVFAEKIGIAAMLAGAGRATKEDAVDDAAGLRILKKTGDFVKQGELLAMLYTRQMPEAASACYLRALTFGERQPEKQPLILDRIGAKR